MAAITSPLGSITLPSIVATSAASPSETSSTIFPSSSSANSTSFYIYTFVITLIVLLLITSCVIVRTCVVRRRFDQRIQEAIEAGVLDPDQVETYRRGGGEIGERPEMWEVTVVKVDKKEMEDVDLESVEVESKEVVSNWAGTMPVSASIVATHANPHSLPFQQLPINITGPQLFSPSACAHEEYPLPPTSFSNTASPSTSNASVPQLSESQLQVAFLIALPTPRTKSNTDASNGQEEPVPQVALGVTEIPWCSKEQWIADDEGVGDAMRTQVAGGYMHGV